MFEQQNHTARCRRVKRSQGLLGCGGGGGRAAKVKPHAIYEGAGATKRRASESAAKWTSVRIVIVLTVEGEVPGTLTNG